MSGLDILLDQGLALHPGLVPTAIDPDLRHVLWTDLSSWHLSGAFFSRSLAELRAFARSPLFEFRSPVSALAAVPVNDSLEPAVFIFHAGRCGSTLLSSILGRSRRLLVYCEAAPHNQIWNVLSGRRDDVDTNLYRALLTAMGRRRIPGWISHAIKFTSYNVMEWQFIRHAFPNAISLFLFREPAAIQASYLRAPPPWLGQDLAMGRCWLQPQAAIRDFFAAALAAQSPVFRCLNYRDLQPRNLPSILRFLALKGAAPDLERMEAAFAWDAKSGLGSRPFSTREPRPLLEPVSAELNDLYRQLDSAASGAWSFAD